MYSVYALVDPRDESIRYIGMSKNVWRRYAMHLLIPSKGAVSKNAWIAELREIDLSPLLKILEIMDTEEEANERETFWILHYLNEGVSLLNVAKIGTKRHPFIEGNSDIAVIARGLKLSEGKVLRLIYSKELPAQKVNGEWQIKQEDFDRWLAENSNQYRPAEDK